MDTGLDIALHLDHGEDFDICKKCVDDGFTSVMIDGSKHPFEENMRLTKEVVEYAHSKGVVGRGRAWVKLAGIEDNIKVDARNATFTVPEEAAEFVAKDRRRLAGGSYRHQPWRLQIQRRILIWTLRGSEEIHKLIPDTPLVLHGASTVLPEFV